jgi:hypothetical protein
VATFPADIIRKPNVADVIADAMARENAMHVLAIDPGPVESAYVFYDTASRKPTGFGKRPNADVLSGFASVAREGGKWQLVVEMIASYGMPVGAEVFETCVWIGRFIQEWEHHFDYLAHPRPALIYRKDVKLRLCGTTKAKDSNIRQRLIDIYGGKEAAIGCKAKPGPLYKVKADAWAALAVAVAYTDRPAAGVLSTAV